MRFNFKMLTFVLVTIALLMGCEQKVKQSPLLNKQISKDNLTQIINDISNDPLITTEQMKYLSTGLTNLLSKSVDSLVGKSLLQVIDYEMNFERSQTVANLANVATRSELVLNHQFVLVGLAPQEDKQNNRLLNSIVFDFTNRSDNDIVDFKGALQVYTQNRQLVKNFIMGRIPILLDNQPIRPGETKRIIYPFIHDPNNANDMALRNDWNDLRRMWIPSEIIFADGTRISVTNTMGDNVTATPNQ